MDTDCILWPHRLNKQGYGMCSYNGKYGRLAHRVAWEKVNGPIPEGMEIDHLCHDFEVCKLGNECPHRRCVNVEHMVLATHAENTERGGAGKHQAAKTHCPQGHPYEETARPTGRPQPGRRCRVCMTESQRRRRLAKRAAAQSLPLSVL